MGSNDTKLYALEILRTGPVIPVVVLGSPEQAAPLARAALEGIRRIAAEVPEMTVGAGTVLTPDDLRSVAQAGGRFAISPGLPPVRRRPRRPNSAYSRHRHAVRADAGPRAGLH